MPESFDINGNQNGTIGKTNENNVLNKKNSVENNLNQTELENQNVN